MESPRLSQACFQIVQLLMGIFWCIEHIDQQSNVFTKAANEDALYTLYTVNKTIYRRLLPVKYFNSLTKATIFR